VAKYFIAKKQHTTLTLVSTTAEF
jgi:hypothetical protein